MKVMKLFPAMQVTNSVVRLTKIPMPTQVTVLEMSLQENQCEPGKNA